MSQGGMSISSLRVMMAPGRQSRRASTAGRPRSANRLGRQPLAGGRTVGRPDRQPPGRQPLAGGQGKAPEGVNRWPARSANRLGVNRWPEGRAKRRRASTAGRPDRRTAWASIVGRRANRWPARSATAWANRLGVNRWPEGEPPGASTAKRKQKGRHYRPDQPDAYIRPS